MCREQLVKLRPHVKELEAEGAAVLAMSMDTPEQASKLAFDLGLTFPILSDPSMEIVREYGMYGKQMRMPEMGYAVIDKKGRIRTQEVDRQFGENVHVILRSLRTAKSTTWSKMIALIRWKLWRVRRIMERMLSA